MSSSGKRVLKSVDGGTEKKTKINRAVVIGLIARHILTGKVYTLEPFPEKFVVYAPEPGEHLFYQVVNDKNEVVQVKKNTVIDAIIRWYTGAWGQYPEVLFEPRIAQEIFRQWLAFVENRPGIVKSFEFSDGKDYVRKRVPFTPDMTADFSHIDIHDQDVKVRYPFIEFLSRCTSPDQLAAFIGSIFQDQSYNQQYLTIWGQGNDGKGSVCRALERILGEAYHSDSFDVMNQFWTSSFVGKRLVVFPDNNNQAAMQRGLWKQMTGGDHVRVEWKNDFVTSVQLNNKYLITSNFAPVLKNDRADQRRAIVVHVEGIPGEIDPRVEAKMHEWDQLKFLVEYCLWKYRTLCPDHQPIPVSADQVEQIQNADEGIEQAFLEKFNFGGDMVMRLHEIQKILGNDRDFSPQKIARVLKSRFGCEFFQYRADGGKHAAKVSYYAGIGYRSYQYGFDSDQAEAANRAVKAELEKSEKYRDVVARMFKRELS